ncbi:hypothetical protein GCM10010116_53930 [Microbispora rosea subsp. aerata]|nr:hypothetical protein GCM10010116_53930 [Microbispora rosea subsp. aerata]
MTTAGAGRLLTLAVELARLPQVREAFTKGTLAAGLVEAICTATAQLTDEQARLAEPILLELAGKAGPAEVAKAGRYLRAVLDPDGEERDEQADYGRRFLRVRPGAGGGMEGEFYLPREAAARLRALLDAYAKPKAEGDDRPLRVRYADAFIALLEDKIVTELLVLVSAESLPADPEPDHPARDPEAEHAESAGHPEGERPDSTDRPEAGHPATAHPERTDRPAAASPASTGPTTDHPEAGHPATAHPERTGRPAAGSPASTGPATDHPEAERAESTGHAGTDAAAANLPGPANGFATDAAVRNPGGGDCPWTCRPVSDHLPVGDLPRDTGGAADARDAEGALDRRGGEDASASDSIRSCEAPSEAVDTGDSALGQADDTIHPAWDGAGNPCSVDRPGTCYSATAHAETGHAESADRSATFEAERAASGQEREGAQDAENAEAIEDSEAAEDIEDGRSREAAREGRRAAVHEGDAKDIRRQGHMQGQVPRSGEPRWGEGRRSCDPPGDTRAHHAHAGPRPAGEIPHGPGPEPGAPGTAPGPLFGTAAGAAPGAARGSAPGWGLGVGVVPGLVPGLLLATGQVLPVSSVHRLARTSTLMRIVMDAQGQVLDMGRKVRLATPAQRRAIFTRYATCWVDGCPLPATMCQIDHADNWSSGGLTDLNLLGPACQFHNRDRYRHPDRYTRRKVGKDRWAFTYHRLGSARRL